MRRTLPPAGKSARIFCLWLALFLVPQPSSGAATCPATSAHRRLHDRFRRRRRLGGALQGRHVRHRPQPPHCRSHASGECFFHSRRRSLPVRRHTLLPGGNGIRGGGRSRRGQFTQGGGGEIEARAIFRVARQRPDDDGRGPRRHRSAFARSPIPIGWSAPRFPPPSMAGIFFLPSALTSRAATTGPRSDPQSRNWSGSI